MGNETERTVAGIILFCISIGLVLIGVFIGGGLWIVVGIFAGFFLMMYAVYGLMAPELLEQTLNTKRYQTECPFCNKIIEAPAHSLAFDAHLMSCKGEGAARYRNIQREIYKEREEKRKKEEEIKKIAEEVAAHLRKDVRGDIERTRSEIDDLERRLRRLEYEK